MKETERVLKALANRRRLALVTRLKQQPEASVGELAAFLRVTFPTASKHLAILGTAEIVEYERRSLRVYYRLAADMPAVAKAVLKHL